MSIFKSRKNSDISVKKIGYIYENETIKLPFSFVWIPTYFHVLILPEISFMFLHKTAQVLNFLYIFIFKILMVFYVFLFSGAYVFYVTCEEN